MLLITRTCIVHFTVYTEYIYRANLRIKMCRYWCWYGDVQMNKLRVAYKTEQGYTQRSKIITHELERIL